MRSLSKHLRAPRFLTKFKADGAKLRGAYHSRKQVFSALLVSVCLGVLMSNFASAQALPSFADLVEANAPSIVEISTINRVDARSFGQDSDIDELLRRLNPGGDPNFSEDDLPAIRERGAVGSGFIISNDGFVITNHHVVARANEIQVHLNDRRVFKASVVGMDEPSDLALLKIDANNLPHVKIGDSDEVRVGDWVLAIGSPFGLEFSAAAGIVSAKRPIPGNSRSLYEYMSFIQTDVAINQGNSGGPLFNLAGEVVGINSQILSSTGASNGISFSIPSNVAMNVVNQLQENGVVRRGLLGVRIRQVDYALAEIFAMKRPHGAFVDDVRPGSPAEKAGMRNEDIVLAFNGRTIEYSADLPFHVGQFQPGSSAEVTVFRDGEELNLTVILGDSPMNAVAQVSPEPIQERVNPLGFRVADLSEEARQVSGLSGVRITELSNGPGKEAGLQQDDVIVALNRQQTPDRDVFSRVEQSLPDSGFVPIRIVRGGQATTLAIELTP